MNQQATLNFKPNQPIVMTQLLIPTGSRVGGKRVLIANKRVRAVQAEVASADSFIDSAEKLCKRNIRVEANLLEQDLLMHGRDSVGVHKAVQAAKNADQSNLSIDAMNDEFYCNDIPANARIVRVLNEWVAVWEQAAA